MILLMLAATLGTYTAPVPVHRDSWISAAIDFPVKGVDRNTFTGVAVDITVTPRGGVSECRGRAIAGNPGMAGYTCKLLAARALFEPARDPSGRRMFGVHRDLFYWVNVDQPATLKHRADVQFEVKVPQLPAGTKEPAIALVQFAVDPVGSASSCSPVPKETALAQLACAALGPAFRAEPARDRKGRPVPSVQNARVRLILAGAGR